MAQLTFTLGDLLPWFRNFAEDAKKVNWQPAFKKIALLLEEAAKENFEGSHAPDGTRWKELKQPRSRPRDRKARPGFGQKPLRDSGLLMASLSATGQHHVEKITESTLTWGTNLEYAGVHQFGHTFQRPEKRRDKPWVFQKDGRTIFTKRIRAHTQTVPARPFLGLNDNLKSDIGAILLEEFQKQVLGGR
jgi:phage gpG-like protein